MGGQGKEQADGLGTAGGSFPFFRLPDGPSWLGPLLLNRAGPAQGPALPTISNRPAFLPCHLGRQRWMAARPAEPISCTRCVARWWQQARQPQNLRHCGKALAPGVRTLVHMPSRSGTWWELHQEASSSLKLFLNRDVISHGTEQSG